MSTTKSQTYPSIPLPKASIKRILCASSLTPESDEALDYALLLARSYGANSNAVNGRDPYVYGN